MLRTLEDRLNAESLDQWKFETIVWALLAPHTDKRNRRRSPELPEMLGAPKPTEAVSGNA